VFLYSFLAAGHMGAFFFCCCEFSHPGHANGSIQANGLTIEHHILNDLGAEKGILRRVAHSLWKLSLLHQAVTDLVTHERGHGGSKETWGNGDHTDAEGG